jgi:exodeoxyribonuclease VIII
VEKTIDASGRVLHGLVNMTNDEYHAAIGYSSSHIKDAIDLSLLHFWHMHENPNREPEEKDAYNFGQATHTAVLEPDLLTSTVVKAPPFNLRTKDGRAERDNFAEENAGKIILLPDEYESVLKIRDRVHAHPVVSGLLTGGKAEQSFFAIDNETGELIKCRPDYLHDNGFAMIDVKTTKNAAPSAFAKDAANYHYHVSPPWYFDVLETLYGETPEHFIFLALEKEPPYAMGLYFAQPADMERGRALARRQFLRIIEAKRANRWPDYAEEVLPLELPAWAKR